MDVERLTTLEFDSQDGSNPMSKPGKLYEDEPHTFDADVYGDEEEDNPLRRHDMLNVSIFLSTASDVDLIGGSLHA